MFNNHVKSATNRKANKIKTLCRKYEMSFKFFVIKNVKGYREALSVMILNPEKTLKNTEKKSPTVTIC